MRFLATFCTALFLALTAGGPNPVLPATAQAQSDSYVRGAQEMLSWMQEANTVTLTASQAFNGEIMAELTREMGQPVVDTKALAEARNQYVETSSAGLAQVRTLYSQLEAPTRWNIGGWRENSMERAIYDVARDQYETLPSMLDDFESVSNSLLAIVDSVITGEEQFDYDKFSTDMAIVTTRVLENENKLLTAFASALPEDSPNHWFHRIIIASNNVLLEEAKLIGIYLETDPNVTFDLRRQIGSDMLEESRIIAEYIQKGRARIEPTRRQLEGMRPSLTLEAERRMMAGALEANQAFHDAFDVEARIDELQRSNATLYASDRPDTKIDPIINENDAEFFMLSQQRLAMQMERMQMVNR